MRVLIADDHDLLRDTLVLYFRQDGGMEPFVAADLPQALEQMTAQDPFDLVVLDFGMPGMNGLDGLRRALDHPKAKAVALMSGTAARDIAEKAMEMGASGFLPKTLAAKTLANAVKFMALGEKYAPVDFMTQNHDAIPNPLAKMLTRRELQVLGGLGKGKSNKEIARDLEVMEPTVKLHVKTLYRKIGASNRTHAAMIAKEAGLF